MSTKSSNVSQTPYSTPKHTCCYEVVYALELDPDAGSAARGAKIVAKPNALLTIECNRSQVF